MALARRRLKLDAARSALVIVDLQRYYVELESNFSRYFEKIHPGAMEYISQRCQSQVLPNLSRLLKVWREMGSRVVYLRLCGLRPDRRDLHFSFREIHEQAQQLGFHDVYPLQTDVQSEVVPALQPQAQDRIFCKTTYSGFTSSDLGPWLARERVETLVFAGLATSQCVETTARDAADRGYHVVHLEDAQADYEELTHRASLYSSQGICGGHIYSTDELLKLLKPGPRP